MFRFSFATDVARGMSYLHQHRICHGRLKSLNCVLDDRWVCKITGRSKTYQQHNSCIYLQSGLIKHKGILSGQIMGWGCTAGTMGRTLCQPISRGSRKSTCHLSSVIPTWSQRWQEMCLGTCMDVALQCALMGQKTNVHKNTELSLDYFAATQSSCWRLPLAVTPSQ